jgi:hypothetical protein
MARTPTPPKPIATDLVVPLDPADANYRKRFVRIDGTRCLALGSRSARWLEGDEPGALLDLGDGAYGSAPFVLPDGRVVLAGLEGFVVLDRTTANYASNRRCTCCPRGSPRGPCCSPHQGGRGRVGTSTGDSVRSSTRAIRGVWSPAADGVRAPHRRGCAAWSATTRHDHHGVGAVGGTDEGSPFYRGVGVTGASAHGDRLVVTHHGLAAIAHWRGDAARRIHGRAHDARVTRAVLRTRATRRRSSCLDAQGDARWTTATERYTSPAAPRRSCLLSRKGECVLVLEPGRGVPRSAAAGARRRPLRGHVAGLRGRRCAVPGALVAAPARRAPQKLAHPGLGGPPPPCGQTARGGVDFARREPTRKSAS